MNNDDLSTFGGRKPAFSFSRRGPALRGFRSRSGAPQADTTSNLPMSEDNRTPDALWNMRFKDSTAAEPAANGGIAGQTLDAAFGPGFWGSLLGAASASQSGSAGTLARRPAARGPTVASSPLPSMDTPAQFMPQSPSRPFNVPKPLTGPLGDKASDRANLTQAQAMYAPGGMTGFWGRQAARPEQWEKPNIATAADIATRYRPRV